MFCGGISSLQAPQLVAAPEGRVIILSGFQIVFMHAVVMKLIHGLILIDTTNTLCSTPLMWLEGLPPKLVEAPNLVPLSKKNGLITLFVLVSTDYNLSKQVQRKL